MTWFLLFFSQSCPLPCDPMDSSTPGFPVLHHFPELAQTHVHWVSDAYKYLIFCRPFLLQPSIFPSIRVFNNELAVRSGGQSIGAPASASVFPKNTQDLFALGLTSLNSLQSKGLSRVSVDNILSRISIDKSINLIIHDYYYPTIKTRMKSCHLQQLE